MKKAVGIYKITSPSGKVYIGQSWNIEHRWAEYRSPSYRARQPKLIASFRKYGVQSHDFQIIFLLGPHVEQSVLDACEIFYIEFFRGRGVHLLNIREGGSTGRHSEETKLIIGSKSKGHPPNSGSFQKGRPPLARTAAWLHNLSESLRGKRHSEQARARIRAARKRQIVSHSSETKAKIGAAHLGRVFSEDTRSRMSERAKQNYASGQRAKRFGDESYFHKLTAEQVREIKRDYVPRRVTLQCLANRYGVSPGAIGKIIRGESWVEI